ncbi:MAG: NAD-dependent epimerase/dehydratase family protein [Sporomusaceae bacterium]|nr:NAD-dependent epimerase/dehydratase family protein [Sporomusaceae bacterium]
MKVLVTGGAGFIGSHLSRKLLADGHTVVIYDNLSTGRKEHVPAKVKLVVGDIRHEMMSTVLATEKFDAVVHLAAQTGVPASIESPLFDADVNIQGSVRLLEACRTYGVKRVVFASTAAVYGDVAEVPVKEAAPTVPTSFYGLSKLTIEKYLALYQAQFGLSYVVLRFANVYGERQGDGGEGGVVSIFSRKCFQDEPVTIFGTGEQTRDFVYAGDVAEAILLALQTDKDNQVYNVSTKTEITVNELLHCIETVSAKKMSTTYEPPREGDIFRSFLENQAITSNLGWKAKTTLPEGLARTYKFLCGKGS